ncbi:hypothetical protein OO013_10415 [Mangrovivirga sp. M17]|uniref:DUF1292 domain-containing protein n=1 Tax=Mangrovivirga halotolerans TaxID=2993936 RepID=A0ABT3RRT5_9BACT|nr:hypothetical protein [Mangrovivirga halotolerans]MCX2744282.1 hypothetical protein [Mangrovivirga halotolerans]
MEKKRIVKDYDKLPEEVINQVKLEYPYGFAENLVSFVNAKGEKVSALPFDTDDVYYLIRMTKQEAVQLIEDDDDYDEFGKLSEEFIEDQEEDEGDED